MLFAEATTEQAGVVKACLDDFCVASGEKVNENKSRVYFSENVGFTVRKEIASFLGFLPTSDLGKYLGVPLLHKNASRQAYNGILEKMDKRLANWKINSLSFAARSTLISSVVSGIPSYTMQSTSLPLYTCDEVNKRCRKFLWGSTSEVRKPHLVAWKEVCRKKEDGDLGLREARSQNKAFMMKLGWNLVNTVIEILYGCGFYVKSINVVLIFSLKLWLRRVVRRCGRVFQVSGR